MVCALEVPVRFGKTSRKLLLGLVLFMGVAFGAPVRPEEIEEMLSESRKAKTVHVMKQEDEDKESE